jgi:hypothetical protein
MGMAVPMKLKSRLRNGRGNGTVQKAPDLRLYPQLAERSGTGVCRTSVGRSQTQPAGFCYRESFAGLHRMTREEFLSVSLENSRRLSRTRGGVADATASSLKKISLTGERLSDRARSNEEVAANLVWSIASADGSLTSAGLLKELMAIASAVNDGLVPAGKLFREWIPPEGSRCEVGAIRLELNLLMSGIVRLMNNRGSGILAAATAEWALNGGHIHPFYDGCGRIARLFGGRLLVTCGTSLPLWEDRATYFDVGLRGIADFALYMEQRIDAAASWLAGRNPDAPTDAV